MQLLQGTDVVLNGETVGNVLVGEPSNAAAPFGAGTVPGYVLGIPKADAHDWTGIVEVFGRTFRTVGIPEEGIAANIPTPWHKRVHIGQSTPDAQKQDRESVLLVLLPYFWSTRPVRR